MKRPAFRPSLPRTGAIYGIVLFVVFFTIMTDNYLTASNFGNIMRQAAVLCIITICSFLAILTHQTDLSVGGVASLGGMMAALALEAGAPIPVACLCAVLVGLGFGLVNGLLAGLTTIPPFIITLATMSIAESAGMVARTATIQITSESWRWFSGGYLGFLPFPAVLVGLLYLGFWYLLRHRRYGTYLYAVGGKEEAALTAGINVRWTKMSVYLINGALAGLAGIMLSSRLSAANPSSGLGLELDGICSAVLGGAALTGGRGHIGGALLGAVAISILRNGMNMMGLRLVIQKLVIGVVLIVILALDVMRKEGGDRREQLQKT